ncbi:MAG: sigma-E processing peptidase SpoIIGA [Clostridia bacterium]|nr:sigma-E processing peptidase SpoIIGA [Clostridia bacterium]
MKTVIYADILAVLNILINYLLLRSEAAITSFGFKPIRFLISSITGGLFSLIIFADNINSTSEIILKTTVLCIMVIIAFEIKTLKTFFKYFAVFLCVNFIFAGIMLAADIFLIPGLSIFNNGIYYFDIDILTLTITAVVCYIIIYIINLLFKIKTPEKSVYPIKITYHGKITEGKALFDSGNTLCDCFSGKPVIIADNKLINKIIDTEHITKEKNFRLIPFSTINGNGTLYAFSADYVGIFIHGKWITCENVYIGITEKKIISGEYSALFGIPFYETISDQIGG